MEQNVYTILMEATWKRLLHLGATGSLFSKIHDLPTQKQKMIKKCCCFRHSKKGQLCLPVTEIVSWSHYTLAISSWQTQFIHNLGKGNPRKGNNVFVVVTDFS